MWVDRVGGCMANGQTGPQADNRAVRYVPSPDSCRAAKFTHSITSSAIASRPGGMITPSALTVLTLIVSSYLIGSCTGNSATFAPLRIRSTYDAPRLYKSAISDP